MNIKLTIDDFSSVKMLNKKFLIAEVILLLYGLFLLIFPAQGLNLSVAFIGVIFILAGAFCVFRFLKNREDGNYTVLAIGLVGIVVGILSILFRASIALILFPILLGLWTFLTAAAAGLTAWSNFKSNNGLWWIPLLAALVALVVTVMIFMNLSGTERFMARILGIYFITYNLVRLAEYWTAGRNTAAYRGNGRTGGASQNRRGSSSRRRGTEVSREEEYDVYDYKKEDDGYGYDSDYDRDYRRDYDRDYRRDYDSDYRRDYDSDYRRDYDSDYDRDYRYGEDRR